jgi:acyl transferase domain-containing protein
MEVVSALGADLEDFDRALRTRAGGLRAEPDGTFLGRMPHPDWDGPGDPLAEFLATVLAGACRRAGLDATAVLADPDTLLILSTTKGDIAGLLATSMDSPEAASGGGETRLGPFLGRVRRAVGHRGHAELVSAACASGAVAIARAARLLEAGWGRRALVLGFDRLDPFLVAGFRCLGAMGTSACRPYDDDRDGLSLGEAAAAVLLVPDDAPGVRLAGSGLAGDAFTIVRPCDDGSGLALAIRRAFHDADAPGVDGICGHGTATVANDAMEAAAFRAAFPDAIPPVFGLKGATGHTLGACGLLEAVACALAIRGGFLPGTTGFGATTSGLDVVTLPRAASPRRLLTVNAGFGGLNAALVLEG